MWICSSETWNLTSLTMKGTAYQIASWDVICSPWWKQQKKSIPIGFKSWPQTWMPWINPRTRGRGKSNLMHNVEEKRFKTKWKVSWLSEQKIKYSPPSPCKISSVHDVNQKLVKDGVEERMVVQFIWNVILNLIYSPFYKLHKRRTQVTTSKGRSFRMNLKSGEGE